MKPNFLLLFLSLPISLFAQQSEIKGIISIHNSEYETGKRQYVANAQVEDDFAKATSQLTDANGNFKLVFVRVPEKASVKLIVKKEDLQVVNMDGLSAVTGQRDLVRLSMAKPDKIAEYRRQIYNVGKTEAEKNLAAQLKKKGAQIESLQKDAIKNKVAIEQLQKESTKLQAFASKIEEQAQDLARRYAPINLDDAAPLYREAFRAFQQGELGQALQILRGADLVNQANKILAAEEAINSLRIDLNRRDSIKNQRKLDLMQVLGLKADLHKGQFEWDSVSFCLDLRVVLDSTNTDNIWDLAFFYSNHNQTQKALVYFIKGLSIASKDKIKAEFCVSIGNLYSKINDIPKAEKHYLEALDLFLQLFDQDSISFQAKFAKTKMNLALLYAKDNRLKEAEKYYTESLSTLEQLFQRDTLGFRAELAQGLANIGAFYLRINKLSESEKYRLRSYGIYQNLVMENPTKYEPDLARVAINLGVYFNIAGRLAESEKYYLIAISIYEKLVKNSPREFENYLSMSYMNLGNTYYGTGKIQESENMYLKSLTIREKLIKTDSLQYTSDLVITLGNLAEFKLLNKKFEEAEAYALRAIELDATQTWIKVNLIHAQLFQFKDIEAKKGYSDMMKLKDENGRDYIYVLKDEFSRFEQAGLNKKQILKARKWIMK